MNAKDRMIMDEFLEQRPNFVRLGDLVHELLRNRVEAAGISVLGIEHRVKEEKSLAGKLERKGDKYRSLADLTDILGARVICFFADEVDKIGKIMEELFEVDWENSVDKRALIKADSFGYLSLHYICSLPENKGYPADLCGKKFEIQVRTTLQHTWAVINHDLGYKSEFGVPRMAIRQYARIASLLEIADNEFVQVRDDVRSYTEEIRRKIAEDAADDILIDTFSLSEYVLSSKKMRDFLERLAGICGAEITQINPESYIVQLRWLGKTDLGDVKNMINENADLAFALAEQSLAQTDLDILSSNVGLRFLCRAELLRRGMSETEAAEFLKLSVGSAERAARQAKTLFANYGALKAEGKV